MKKGTCERCRRMNQWVNASWWVESSNKARSGQLCNDCFETTFRPSLRCDGPYGPTFGYGVGGGERIVRKGTEMS